MISSIIFSVVLLHYSSWTAYFGLLCLSFPVFSLQDPGVNSNV